MKQFGIDIGGSGIKGALVDLETGRLEHERIRFPTPRPATPQPVADVVAKILDHASWRGRFGCTFPGVVQNGITRNATNLHDDWVDLNAEEFFQSATGQTNVIQNDADAAGIAEMQFGAGRDYREHGVVVMLTFGTGIGSAVFTNGLLVPNTELGTLELDGQIAEQVCAGRMREENLVDLETWISRVERYLRYVEELFWPDLLIFGGGISAEAATFLPQITTRTPVVPATLRNNAGIVGAALSVDNR